MPDTKDTQSRKWQLTLNNPLDYGFTHEKIRELATGFTSFAYFCMADEIGLEEKTPHTHVYIAFSSAVRFSSIKNAFPGAHIEQVRGTSQQNRDYIAKEGKWANDEKHGTSIPGTFEEHGEMPVERQGARADLHRLHELILSGKTNVEILDENPGYMKSLSDIERVRQEYKAEQYRRIFRNLTVVYIYGQTGTGKTRGVMESHGYENVYRVSEYDHPFDGYLGQEAIVLDEFQSQFRISEMLNYMDGYPLSLPCRYANKQACYTTVYIISNWELHDQYPNVKLEKRDTWLAFMRRIHKVVHVTETGREEMTTAEYLSGFRELPPDVPTPWDKPGEQMKIEREK